MGSEQTYLALVVGSSDAPCVAPGDPERCGLRPSTCVRVPVDDEEVELDLCRDHLFALLGELAFVAEAATGLLGG